MTTTTNFEPTIQEIHQMVGEPFKLEIGTWTMDGYTGDSVYYNEREKKHTIHMNVNHYIDQVELRVNIYSLYGHTAKKKAVLLEKLRDTLKWTEAKVIIAEDKYKTTKGYFMLAARNENEMKILVEVARMLISEVA